MLSRLNHNPALFHVLFDLGMYIWYLCINSVLPGLVVLFIFIFHSQSYVFFVVVFFLLLFVQCHL